MSSWQDGHRGGGGYPAPPASPSLIQQNLPASFRPIPVRSSGNPCFLMLIAIFGLIEYLSYSLLILRPALFSAPKGSTQTATDLVNSWYGGLDDETPSFWGWRQQTLWGCAVNPWVLMYSAFFHWVVLMIVVCFAQTSCTDPGEVPPHWGFYVGDESKRRRYCKICNVWKPDRTHHCSACGRCVLNMDHHCPWVNNCVGFYNRKFFIQLLAYALTAVACIIAHGAWHIWRLGRSATGSSDSLSWSYYWHFTCATLTVTAALLLFLPLCPFLRLHIMLIRRNTTTIEDLDLNNKNRRRFDLGPDRNCAQVMGSAWFLWWLPCHTRLSHPHGDGVRWPQSYLKALETSS